MSITSWVGAKGVSEYVQGHGNLEGNYKAHEERGGLLKRFIRLLSFFVIEAPCYVSWVLTVWLFSITATWPMEESKQVQLDLCCLVITFFFLLGKTKSKVAWDHGSCCPRCRAATLADVNLSDVT